MNNEQYNQIIDEAYENYSKEYEKDNSVGFTMLVKMVDGRSLHKKPSKDMFVAMCTHDKTFSEKWELKIEQRDLTMEERIDYALSKNDFRFTDAIIFGEDYEVFNIPTKLMMVTYKGNKTEVYE